MRKSNKFISLITLALPSSDGKCDTEIKRRIGIAKDAFQKMRRILTDRKLSVHIKIKILHCYVYPILTYGSECWTISPPMKKKLEAAEMWFYRRMWRISWTQHISNSEVLRWSGTERKLMKDIRQRQSTFFGHVMRKGQMENIVLTGKIEGKRRRGRPRLTYISSLAQWIGTDEAEVIKATRNRERWKTMIANVRIG